MDKFIPFEKLSKKKQQELCKSRRGSWHGVNPVTRKSKDAKAYNRNKARKWSEESMTVPFVFSRYHSDILFNCQPGHVIIGDRKYRR